MAPAAEDDLEEKHPVAPEPEMAPLEEVSGPQGGMEKDRPASSVDSTLPTPQESQESQAPGQEEPQHAQKAEAPEIGLEVCPHSWTSDGMCLSGSGHSLCMSWLR